MEYMPADGDIVKIHHIVGNRIEESIAIFYCGSYYSGNQIVRMLELGHARPIADVLAWTCSQSSQWIRPVLFG